jgi:hypothetical protein
MRLSGDCWCEAHIASGDDEAKARVMAERTIAAYTTAPGGAVWVTPAQCPLAIT